MIAESEFADHQTSRTASFTASVDATLRSVRCWPAAASAPSSSAVDEDGADASFAGQHLTLLNVRSTDAVKDAVREVWWSANSDSAITYRQRVGLFRRPSVGVVVQSLLDPDSAGVMFTRNPITGDDELMIEASWGLGEAVVAGLVIPDNFRVARSGEVLARTPGLQADPDPLAAGGRDARGGGAPELAEQLCLDDAQLAELTPSRTAASRSTGRRATSSSRSPAARCTCCNAARSPRVAGADAWRAPRCRCAQVPLFADLDDAELEQVARLFKQRTFAAGETVAKEGSGGAAFFLIESGEATVTVGGQERAARPRRLLRRDRAHRRGRALGDDHRGRGARLLWPDLLGLPAARQENAAIGWKLLQFMVARLRAAESRA